MSYLVSPASQDVGKFSKDRYYSIKEGLSIVPEITEESKPVRFACYLRTDRDNLVLTHEESFVFFDDSDVMNAVGSMISYIYDNILVDLSLYTCQKYLNSVFGALSKEAITRVVLKSHCYPVGAVETEDRLIVVSNIIISADLLTDPEIALSEGYTFHPIETLKIEDNVQKAISESLVYVKSDKLN